MPRYRTYQGFSFIPYLFRWLSHSAIVVLGRGSPKAVKAGPMARQIPLSSTFPRAPGKGRTKFPLGLPSLHRRVGSSTMRYALFPHDASVSLKLFGIIFYLKGSSTPSKWILGSMRPRWGVANKIFGLKLCLSHLSTWLTTLIFVCFVGRQSLKFSVLPLACYPTRIP